MKRTITGIALISTLVFATMAWGQKSPMENRNMGMGKSPRMKSCMKMMSAMEAKNAALDELVERMHSSEGTEKIAAMEELLTSLIAQRREMAQKMRDKPQMMCGAMMTQ